MPYAVLEKSGCGIHKNRAKLRLDFFLNPDDPHYAPVSVPVIPEDGYPGKVDKEGMPKDRAGYDAWLASLPHIWQNNPFHTHFIYPDLEATDDAIKAEIEKCLDYFYSFHTHCWDTGKEFIDKWKKVPKRAGDIKCPFVKGDTKDLPVAQLKVQDITNRIAEFQISKSTIPPADLNIRDKGTIDIGAAAIDRGSYWSSALNTLIDLDNPANASGIIDTIAVWVYYVTMTGFVAGTFYYVSSAVYKCRDSEAIGNVTAGSKQTFTNLSIDVLTNDYAGCYFEYGFLERDTSGYGGIYYVAGQYIDPGDQATYTLAANNAISVYGTGTEVTVYDETGKLQVILAVQGETENAVRAETGITQTILVAQGESDIQAMVETGKEQTILGVLTAVDIQAMVETGKEVLILTVVGEADGWLYIETGKEQTILAVLGESDTQAMVETGKLQIVLVVPGEADVQTMQELGKLQVILAVLTSADIQTMSELSRLQEILAVVGETEALALDETAREQIIKVILESADIQAMVETGKLQLILAVVGKKEGRLLTSSRTTSPTRVLDAIREEGVERVLDSEIVT